MAIPSSSMLLDAMTVLSRAGIRAGASLADFGCGTQGHFVVPAALMVGGKGMVYAVDIMKPVLAGVESRAKQDGIVNLKTVWGDCERPNGSGLIDSATDITLVINNLYQAKDRPAFLREAMRVTKLGGRVMVIDWKTAATPLGPPAESRVSAETIRNEAVAVGLKFSDSFEPGPYHWGLIFTK